MLYLIHGENMDSSIARRRSLLETLRSKRPGAHEVRLEGDEITADRLAELVSARGLFEPKLIVLLDGALESATSREALLGVLSELARSASAFIVFERGAIDAVAEKALAALAVKIFLSSPSVRQTSRVSAASASRRESERGDRERFALADALGERDRRGLWVRYARLRFLEGRAAEELHGILFWEVRAMLSARESASPAEAGLAPFPFSKAKRYATRYSADELRSLAERLVALYHDARRGIHDLDTALEGLILEVV
jgi:hypothetical protein